MHVEHTPSPEPNRRDSFDRNATAYAAGRPPYPPRVWSFLQEIGALYPGAHILEIGPGTGLATGELLRHGAAVDAVEQGSRLASILRARMPHDHLRVIEGDAHTIPFPATDYDAAVAATTLHWLDTDRLLPRLARVIHPGGWLVSWWNVFGDPDATTSFRERVSRIYARHLPDEWRDPREIPRAMRIDDRIAELTQHGWFGEPRHELIRWTHRMDASGVRALFATFPNIEELDDARRAAILGDVGRAVEEEGGAIDDPFVTAIYAARRTATPAPDG
jgi:SAM-dependent methyltransferase